MTRRVVNWPKSHDHAVRSGDPEGAYFVCAVGYIRSYRKTNLNARLGEMAHKVFICHSSKDKLVADAACAALEAQGIPVWIAPRDILAGVEFGKAIIDAISESQIVLLIFSIAANNSPQVRREIERAVSKGKPIVPFRIEDAMPSDAMEYALSNTHWLDARVPPMEYHLAHLCDSIARLLEGLPRAEAAQSESGDWADGPQAKSDPIPRQGKGAHTTKNLGRKIAWTAGLIGAWILVASIGFLWIRNAPSPQLQYKRITFRNGSISNARFAPDERAVIYSAAWEGAVFKLYSAGLDGTDARAFDLPSSNLLAVSHSGEMAIELSAHLAQVQGRLAQVPLSGGKPRELLDNIFAADWSPDGTQLAVAREDNGKCRLEFPIGNLLYENNGMITFMRISPQGDAIAFTDQPIMGDDRGTIALVDLKGRKTTLTQEWNGEEGLAWSPDGKEIWFTATRSDYWNRGLYAVSRSGKQRSVLSIPGAMYLQDIASDGRVLFKRDDRRYEVVKGTVGAGTSIISRSEIDESTSISRDGKYALVGDYSTTPYYVDLENLDGSQPVRLGSGLAGDISPDNKWATAVLPTDMGKVQLLPTGMGSPKSITAPNFQYQTAYWTSDGLELVVVANQTGRPLRNWVQDLNGGSPRAITPEGVVGRFMTVNHADYVSARDANGTNFLFPIHGGSPQHIAGLTPSDEVIGGLGDSESVLVSPDPSAIPTHIEKVSIATGRRESFLDLEPNDPVGITGLGSPIFSIDTKRYVYYQVRDMAVLYVVNEPK